MPRLMDFLVMKLTQQTDVFSMMSDLSPVVLKMGHAKVLQRVHELFS